MGTVGVSITLTRTVPGYDMRLISLESSIMTGGEGGVLDVVVALQRAVLFHAWTSQTTTNAREGIHSLVASEFYALGGGGGRWSSD